MCSAYQTVSDTDSCVCFISSNHSLVVAELNGQFRMAPETEASPPFIPFGGGWAKFLNNELPTFIHVTGSSALTGQLSADRAVYHNWALQHPNFATNMVFAVNPHPTLNF